MCYVMLVQLYTRRNSRCDSWCTGRVANAVYSVTGPESMGFSLFISVISCKFYSWTTDFSLFIFTTSFDCVQGRRVPVQTSLSLPARTLYAVWWDGEVLSVVLGAWRGVSPSVGEWFLSQVQLAACDAMHRRIQTFDSLQSPIVLNHC